MAKKKAVSGAVKKASAKKKTAVRRVKSVADNVPKPTEQQTKDARLKFVKGVINRGEAVPEGQPLPPGATHVIKGVDQDGNPIIERKRFSMY
jgi:hypothetical protein